MWRFENFEARKTEEQEMHEDFGVNSEKLAEWKANPTEKVEEQKNEEEKNRETQEKLEKSKQEIANVENSERQAEIAQVESSFDSDFWPPIIDDTDSETKAQIGNTEGATSLDRNVEV